MAGLRGVAVNPDDGVQLAFEEYGSKDAETVLLVHGTALSRATWRGLGYVKALEPDYRVVTVDLRGHGRSGKPHVESAYGIERFLSDLVAVIDTLKVQKVHYVGYSLGARLGFSLAQSQPHRLSSLTSLAGTYRITPGTLAELFFPEYDEVLVADGMEGFIKHWEQRIGHPIDGATALALRINDPLALHAYFARAEEADGMAERELAEVTTPTLLMAGSNDRRRLTDSVAAASIMPDARCIELPGRTHMTTLFPPQAVLDELIPFLRGH